MTQTIHKTKITPHLQYIIMLLPVLFSFATVVIANLMRGTFVLSPWGITRATQEFEQVFRAVFLATNDTNCVISMKLVWFTPQPQPIPCSRARSYLLALHPALWGLTKGRQFEEWVWVSLFFIYLTIVFHLLHGSVWFVEDIFVVFRDLFPWFNLIMFLLCLCY